MLRIDIISVQPRMFAGFLTESIVARAVRKGACAVNLVDLRDFGEGRWKKVDDKPYGGGPGMLMKCGPWFDAVAHCVGPDVPDLSADAFRAVGVRTVMTDPKGLTFTQRTAASLAANAVDGALRQLVFLCGHYEGFDARVETLATDRLSLGDFVLTGGELAAAAMADAVVRLLPGVLGGGPAATAAESFGVEGLLECPQYTHPPEFRGLKVPEVLLSGDHRKIEAWRAAEAWRLTEGVRPDLLAVSASQNPAKEVDMSFVFGHPKM